MFVINTILQVQALHCKILASVNCYHTSFIILEYSSDCICVYQFFSKILQHILVVTELRYKCTHTKIMILVIVKLKRFSKQVIRTYNRWQNLYHHFSPTWPIYDEGNIFLTYNLIVNSKEIKYLNTIYIYLIAICHIEMFAQWVCWVIYTFTKSRQLLHPTNHHRYIYTYIYIYVHSFPEPMNQHLPLEITPCIYNIIQ